jgi:LmbE family N-acetylglucosaminyl deacetylase
MVALDPLSLALIVLLQNEAPPAAPAQDERALAKEAGEQAPLDADLRRQVENRLRILDVAAHPDDEDSALLLTFALQGAHPFVMYSTRGEGGQNAAGVELSAALGARREEEVLASNRVVGARAWFLGFEDFGYCKRSEEAFARWGGREEVVRRMTQVLRTVRPHRVFTNHTQTGGHGHHQATAIALFDAVVAAADPARFPEQIQAGLEPWKVDALFVRVARDEKEKAEAAKTSLEGTLRFDYDKPAAPDAGPEAAAKAAPEAADGRRSIAAVAHDALLRHASQGPFSPFDDKKTHDALYHLSSTPFDAKRPEALPDHRVALTVPADAPFTVVDLLAALTQGEPADPQRTTDLLKAAFGLDFVWPHEELTEPRRALGPGEASEVWILAHGRDDLYRGKACAEAVRQIALAPRLLGPVEEVSLHGLEELVPDEADRAIWRGVFVTALRFRVRRDAAPSVPLTGVTGGDEREPKFFSRRWPLFLDFGLSADGAGVGRFGLPLEKAVAAPMVAEVEEAPLVLLRARAQDGGSLRVTLRFPTGRVPSAPLAIRVHDGFELIERGERGKSVPRDHATVVCDAGHNLGTHLEPRFEADLLVAPTRAPERAADGRSSAGELTLDVLEVDPDEKRATTLATLKIPVEFIEVIPPRGARVAFVPGPDATAGRALRTLEVETTDVAPEALAKLDLKGFTTVLLDLRTLGASEALRAQSQRLREFVAGGGHVAVLYHKSGEWNPWAEAKDGTWQTPAPLPLKLSDVRVCEEDAPVRIKKPGHPFFMHPNVIVQADFAGWVQERGLYFPSESYDPAYEELLACADRDEKPHDGGLLVLKNERGGTFVFCAYALHRQLRAGVVGGWRLFANLVGFGLPN